MFTSKQPPVREGSGNYKEILADNNQGSHNSNDASSFSANDDNLNLSPYNYDDNQESETHYNTPPAIQANQVLYKVQILAVKNGPVSINGLKSKYNISAPVAMEYNDGWYRYVAGTYESYSAALAECGDLMGKGIDDAFVVSYQNEVRQPRVIR